MEILTIHCDVCGRPKGDANHWFVVVSDPRHAGAREFEGVAFGSFSSPVDDPLFKREHICGEACAHKRLSQWLETQSATVSREAAA